VRSPDLPALLARIRAGELGAAWTLADRCIAAGWLPGVKRGPCGQWKARLTRYAGERDQVEALGPTGPEALCRVVETLTDRRTPA
jgi:hypothetical protein